MQQIELHCKACNIRLMDYLDESDLLALMDDEQVEEYMNKTGVGEKEGQPVTEEVEEEKTEEPVVEEKPVKKNNSAMIVIVLLVDISSSQRPRIRSP